MQIYEALKNDHKKVLELFDELLALDEHDDHRLDLVEQIRDELIPHSRAEEKVFYNSLRALDADSGKVMHAYNEHLAAETLFRTIQAENGLHVGWKTTAKKLRDALQHHIQEEESEIFALAQKVFSTQEAEQIGTAFAALKPQIREKGLVGTTLDMIANLMPPRISKTLDLHQR